MFCSDVISVYVGQFRTRMTVQLQFSLTEVLFFSSSQEVWRTKSSSLLVECVSSCLVNRRKQIINASDSACEASVCAQNKAAYWLLTSYDAPKTLKHSRRRRRRRSILNMNMRI